MSIVHSALFLLCLSSALAAAQDAKTAPVEKKVPLKVLTAEEQTKLLARRLNGSLDHSFGAFANMFMVRSQMDLGVSVGLQSKTTKLVETELQSVFPAFYKPTFRELLDAIALQTFSTWSYRKEDQVVRSTVPDTKEHDPIVIFTFDPIRPPAIRAKPFHIDLPKGWKSEDRGHWLAFIPATFPVGMDVHELGTYSAAGRRYEAALFIRVRQETALDWAKRVKPDAKLEDLKPARVGGFDALHFDALVPAQDGKDVRWRHWVFMVDNACYFIVSTIFPEMEEKLFPDVQTMIQSFKPTKK